MTDRTGLLLINLGSPASPEPGDVRAYLSEFLSDPFVMDLAAPLRWLLLHAVILPLRSRRSAAAYRTIWTPEGSPLVLHTAKLAARLQERLGANMRQHEDGAPVVRFAMRYGHPSIATALEAFRSEGIDRIHAVPLYPQFAAATTGTVLHEIQRLALTDSWRPLFVSVEPPFYDASGFADLWARRVRAALDAAPMSHVLFSFHGLPLRQIRRSGDGTCLTQGCCERGERGERGRRDGAGDSASAFRSGCAPHCYRAQCLQTARSVARSSGLGGESWSVSFQSRLGRDEWLSPSTQSELERLVGEAPGRPVVVAPLSFVADCLETLEELSLRGREGLKARGLPHDGVHVLPSLNADADWVDFLIDLTRCVGVEPEAAKKV